MNFDTLKSFVEPGSSIPILGTVRIANSRAAVTNMSQYAEMDVPWGIEGCIPFKELDALIRRAGDKEVEATVDGSRATFRAGRMRATLPILPVDDFPVFDVDAIKPNVSFESDDLRAIVHAISAEQVRIMLGGVSVRGEYIEAADGARMARRPAKIALENDAILPADFARFLAKTCEGRIKLSVDNGKAVYRRGDGTIVFSKLINATFPDTGRIWPTEFKGQVELDPEELTAALDTVSLAGTIVKMDCAGGVARFTAVNRDTGAEAEYTADCSGDDFVIGFMIKFLKDVVDAHKGAGFTMQFIDSGSPTLINGDEVLMPCRVG